MDRWNVDYIPQAANDLNKLDHSNQTVVLKAIDKVSTNPLPLSEGGYGKPLGTKNQSKLSGLLKIKLKKSGIRVIYKLIRTERTMTILIIGIRSDNQVYKEVKKRL